MNKDDINLDEYKRKMPNHGFGEPGVVPTQLFVYQFAIGREEDEDPNSFDFRVMDIEHPAYRKAEEEIAEHEDVEIPEEADWVVNQFGGEPNIGQNNYFESLEDAEDKIKELMIEAMKKYEEEN